MRTLPFSVVLTIALLPTWPCINAWSADPKPDNSQVNERLAQVLRVEAEGLAVDRRGQMQDSSGSDAADHWQVGELLVQGEWRAFDELSSLELPKELVDYKAKRGSIPLDESRHREFARWCKSHKLADQERAHWHGVLLTSPDDLEAHQALGHQWIADRWYTPQELVLADEASRRVEAEWSQWMPTMRKLVSQITSQNTRAKQEGLKRLAEIDDPSAVSSLEVTALQLSADQAIPFIRSVTKQHSPEACLALVRISLAYPVDARGEYAMQALSSYPKEFYVPEILGVLSTPIETQIVYSFNPKGELLIRRAMFRETQGERQQMRLNRLVRTAAVQHIRGEDIEFSIYSNYVKFIPPSGPSTTVAAGGLFNTLEDEMAGAKNAAEDQRQLESGISSTNRDLARVANAAYVVLEKCTGVSLEEKPEAWWDWWQEYNQRYAPRKSFRNYEYSNIDNARVYKTASHYNVRQLSCLDGGTCVQTADGLKAIKNIQIGDMVLAQDVETGELALKAVLQTTIRPPEVMLNIVTESAEIKATAGHRWFVAGKGWLMTQELESHMLLHDATGTTRIVNVTRDDHAREAYNLIVEEFQTYFVGPARVLSFDNSDPLPTLRPVPGFGKISLN